MVRYLVSIIQLTLLLPKFRNIQEWAKFFFSFALYINKLMSFFFDALMLFSFLLFDLMLFYFIALLAFLLVLNKEANFWLQWKHQGSLLTEILSKRLCFET